MGKVRLEPKGMTALENPVREGRGSLKQDKLLSCPETEGKHGSPVQGKTERI